MRFVAFFDLGWRSLVEVNPFAVVSVSQHTVGHRVIHLSGQVDGPGEGIRDYLWVNETEDEVRVAVLLAMGTPSDNVRAITPQELAGPAALAALGDLVGLFQRVNDVSLPAGAAMAYVEDVLQQRGLLKSLVPRGR